MFTLHQYPAVAHILTHSVHLAWLSGLNRAFKQKCQVRACAFRFRLQIKARLQLRVAGRLRFDKGLQFCFMAEFTIDYAF